MFHQTQLFWFIDMFLHLTSSGVLGKEFKLAITHFYLFNGEDNLWEKKNEKSLVKVHCKPTMLYKPFTASENTFFPFHGFTYASPSALKNLPPATFRLLLTVWLQVLRIVVYSFSIVAVTNCYKFSGLKQHRWIFFYSSGGQKPKMGFTGQKWDYWRAVCFLRPWGRTHSLAYSSSFRGLDSLACGPFLCFLHQQ